LKHEGEGGRRPSIPHTAILASLSSEKEKKREGKKGSSRMDFEPKKKKKGKEEEGRGGPECSIRLNRLSTAVIL